VLRRGGNISDIFLIQIDLSAFLGVFFCGRNTAVRSGILRSGKKLKAGSDGYRG
jgi:hypothetical protein